MITRFCFLLLILLLVGLPLHAADPLDGFDDYIKAAMAEWQVPGASITVVKDGEVMLMRGYGVTRVDKGYPVTPETVFPLASITKNFTASALAVLVEEETVHWDDPVIRHLPDVRFSDDYRTQNTTICDLLCHRTGLERGDMLPRRNDVTNEDILHRIRYLHRVHGFREKWEYNNLMYYLAGEIVAKASGRGWEQFVTERLLQPLDMNSTTTRRPVNPDSLTAIPHRLIDNKPVPDKPVDARMDYSPAGSMHSTAADMAKWLLASLALSEDESLLKPATRRMMQSIHMSVPASWDRTGNPYAARFYGWGFGWQVLDYQGRKICYHGGSSGAMFAVIPEERLGVVILTNLHWTTISGMLMYDTFDAYLLGPEQAWDRKKWDFWKKADPHPDTVRLKDLKQAEVVRKAETRPSLPLENYAGAYQCDLYGELAVRHDDDRLLFLYGANDPALATHWQDDSFYVRRPVYDDPTMDWIVTFELQDGEPQSLTIKRLGWHESLPRFDRVDESEGNKAQ